jgi:hypothetical protein
LVDYYRGQVYSVEGADELIQSINSVRLRPATPIRNLYLTGSDAGLLGIMGALMGGVLAASRLLGPLGFFQIMRAASS